MTTAIATDAAWEGLDAQTGGWGARPKYVTSPSWRLILSQFAQRCVKCGATVRQFQKVAWSAQVRGVRCVACHLARGCK